VVDDRQPLPLLDGLHAILQHRNIVEQGIGISVWAWIAGLSFVPTQIRISISLQWFIC
jgi:hypothetical protein